MIIENDASQLYSLLQLTGAIVWNAAGDMHEFYFIDEQVKCVLGFEATHWLSTPDFWAARLHPEDKNVINKYKALSESATASEILEYRMIAADGTVVWIKDTVCVSYNDEGSYRLSGVMLDVSFTERLQSIQSLESNILRLNSDLSVSLNEVLMAYLKGLEGLFPRMHCSIHKVIGGRLTEGLAPSLPPEYMDAIAGVVIGKYSGSCGSAAIEKRQVIVSNIATDKRWENYRKLAKTHNLAACWSNPVINGNAEVIAVLGMYYNMPKDPLQEELNVMEKVTSLLRIILENRQQTEMIREANLLMLQSQDLAQFGNWRWDIVNDVVSWSPALYTIYGLDKNNFKATFAGYLERLHADDHDRVYGTIKQVLETGVDTDFEERIFRPDGSIRYLRSWAKLKTDGDGRPLEMIGACLDTTEKVMFANAVEQQNRKLLDIAWLQSHAIRSPLVRILGITDLLCNALNSDEEHKKLLNYLQSSAHELDEQVRLIALKTEENE